MAPNEELERKVAQYEQDKKSGKKKSKKSAIKYALNISFVLIVTAVSIILTTWNKWDSIINNLAQADIKWLFAILGVVLGTILVRSFILFCFARLYTRDYHFHQAIAVDQVGQFYNAVTPGASGGQIMQAYTYKKQGLHISSAVSALAMYSICFQIVLIIYGLLAFIIKFDLIMSMENISIRFNDQFTLVVPTLLLTIIGFLLNVSVILIVLLMGYWHGFHNFIMGPVVGLGANLKILKNPDKTRENLRISVENFKIEFRRLWTNIPFFILVMVSFAIYMTLKFSIPYFCGLALGNDHYTIQYFWDSVFLGNYHQMITGIIPIPGSAGVSEYVFTMLFVNKTSPSDGFYFVGDLTPFESAPGLVKSEALAVSCLLLWRSITFIVPIVAAGLTTAFYKASPKEEAREREDLPNRETFVALQNETYIMRKEEVDAIVHTQSLNRAAIIAKMKEGRKKPSKDNKNQKGKQVPINVEDDDYNELDISDDGEE